jgi:DNA-binding NarL/FixJ family response regulator
MQPVQILIADSRGDVRRRVRTRIEKQTGWIVCAEASTAPETVAKAIELNPDIVLIDEGLPGLSGADVTREISRVAPDVLVLILALSIPDREPMSEPLSASGGAHTLEMGHTLVDAIKTLVGTRTSDDDGAHASADQIATHGHASLEGERSVPLTSREREVLRLLADGKSNKEIGVLLNISTRTVETHRARVMRKLGLHSMNQLVRYAIRHRIISA